MEKFNRSINTPIGLIGIFLSVCEVAIIYASNFADGTNQTILINFAVFFPLIIAAIFFTFIWKKPYIFYPPSEYSEYAKPKDYIGAFQNEKKTKEQLVIEDIKLSEVKIVEEKIDSSDVSETIDKEESSWINLCFEKKYHEDIAILFKLFVR